MTTPILRVKLSIPPSRLGIILRRRLLDRLNEGVDHRLILVSAPAGFGKTTLISTWIVESAYSTAWLSLESADADPNRFLTYLVGALQTISPTLGENALQALSFPQPPPADAILTSIVNDLSSLDEPMLIVFDDYHLINVTPINDVITFLLDHLPSCVHIVMTTREDPQLPLHRLRARGQMTELRAAELRFTASEAATFLNEVMGLGINENEVTILETRTEGWIAGLQLAALSMRGRDDLAGFIRAFAGDDRYIVDYLVEEVLKRQPADVRQFLLQSSVLERMSGSLCDAVTDRNDSTSVLDALERSNLFVVPLDDKRQWYRYHQLFADVLRTHAMEEAPDQIMGRHRRASEWFEQHTMPADAIRHAFAALDSGRAARLVEMSALRMLGSSEEDLLWSWLEALPDGLVVAMPVLSTYYGFASFSRAGLDAAEVRFRDAERWLADAENKPSGEMMVANGAAMRSVPGTIAVGRAYAAGARGDVDGIVSYARQALAIMPEDDDLWSGAASAVLGIGLWTLGELAAAYRSFDEGKTRLEKAGFMQFQIVSVHILADIRIAQGRLREAERIYQKSLELATRDGASLWGTVDILVGLSELLLEGNELESAGQYLQRSKELGDHAGLMDTRHRWHIAMAAIRQAEGDFEGALALLDEAARLYVPGADPDLRPISALKARVWIAQGQLADATSWANERNLAVSDDVRYLREFEHLTVAKVLVAGATQQTSPEAINDALALLGRLLDAAERGERKGSLINILVQRALAYEALNDIPAALESFGRALTLAEPEGYVRTFIAEGPPMLRLLTEAQEQGMNTAYSDRIRTAMVAAGQSDGAVAPHLLSDREVEVLRLIALGLSNLEISERLYLAIDTVKGHNRRIFGKLGVQRRTEAIARARGLGLLEL